MAKTFEDLFTEYQTDMISLSLEYVDYRKEVESVYIYVTSEDRMSACDAFYKIDGMIVPRWRVKYALKPGGERLCSDRREHNFLSIMGQTMTKLIKLCKEYGREMPTEIKIIYDTKTQKVDANYRYDLILTKDPDNMRAPQDGEEDWMAEEAAKLGQAYKRLIG